MKDTRFYTITDTKTGNEYLCVFNGYNNRYEGFIKLED